MRKLGPAFAVMLMTLGLLGCNFIYSLRPTPPPKVLPTQATQPIPQLTGNWQVHLAQTGGFVGVSRRLEISSDGEMTLINERTQEQKTIQLSPEQFTQLKELVASTRYQPLTNPMGCDDCFIFELTIDNGRESFQVQLEDVNLPDAGLETLIGFLAKLLDQNLR